MSKRLRFLILTFLAASVFLSPFCRTKGAIEEVRFGYQPFGSNLPFFIAIENGFFADEGIKVIPEKIISANDAANAVISGSIAGNATVPLNVILNIEENQPGLMKIVMAKTCSRDRWSDYLLVKKGSTINSLAELAGKKVGGYPGSAQQVLLQLVLAQFMKKDEILTVEMPPNVQLQGLDAGQIDALLTYDDLAITALETNIAQILIEDPICKYVVDPLYGFMYVLSSSYIKEHPKVSASIRNAFYRAADFIKLNENESRKIMAKWVGTKPEIAQKVRLWAQVKAEDIDLFSLQKLADIYFNKGIVHKKIDPSRLLLLESDLK